MNLVKALRLSSPPSLRDTSLKSPRYGEGLLGIAFTGAGGKSTGMFQLARQLTPPVIVTATTHLGAWQIPLADKHIIAKTISSIKAIEHGLNGVTLITGEVKDDRTEPLNDKLLSWLYEFCGNNSLPLLIEADGSRQKPLKAPAEHEPAIPEFVEQVVQVVGLTGLGKPINCEFIHRPEIFAKCSKLAIGEIVTPEALASILLHSKGGLKNIPANARRVVLLNQADTPELQAQGDAIAKQLLSSFHSVIVASLKEEKIYAVHEPVAGIILAAGEAARFGQPKQLLEWRGKPFVRAVAKTALEAGLEPVLVVTGAYAHQVELAVQDLPVQIVHNEAWQSGQASSIREGISFLTGPLRASPISRELQREMGEAARNTGGAIFMLADQPQITPTIIHALVEEHATTLAPVIAPMVLDRRGNPVLFDLVTFKDLMKLEGDIGGRGIFSKYNVTYLPWHDDALLLDVDTPEHYQRLKDLLE